MEDIRPTAKWANRMLRPLTSIHHRLQKHYEIRNSIADTKSKAKPDHHDSDRLRLQPNNKKTGPDPGCNLSDEEPDDPAWIPGNRGSRRPRHNYSNRGQRNGARRRSRLLIKSPEVQRTLPGAIEIATPLITGTAPGPAEATLSIRKRLFQNPIPPVSAVGANERRRQSRTNKPSFPAYQGSWKEVLDLSGDPGLVDIARFLDRMLINFLENTRPAPAIHKHEQEGRGARSLLSMAARRLPEFIAEEQRLQDEAEPDEDVDMCDAYFTELEAQYAPGGGGWQPLREAVRAQGIHLISEMMQREWVPKLAACRLLEQCLEHRELDAFETLISGYLTTVKTHDYPTAFDPSKPAGHCDNPIYILRNYYSKAPERRSFIFDEMTKLLSRGAFPPEWMVTTRWKKCVDGAIRSLSIGDEDSAAATRTIEAIILSSAGIYPATDSLVARSKGRKVPRSVRLKDTRASVTKPTSVPKDQAPCPVPIQDALSNLSASLITALCGMYMARTQTSGVNDKLTGRKVRHIVEALSFGVQRAIGLVLSRREMEGPSFHSLRRGYILLGEWTLQCSENCTPEVIGQSDAISPENLESLCLSLVHQENAIKQLADFVQQVFRCCGHEREDDLARTPRKIRAIVWRLAQVTTMKGISLLLAKVAAETAMALAEVTLDVDDHAWALEIQEQAASSQQDRNAHHSAALARVPQTDVIRLYRWEESIGEWVASTPVAKPVAPRNDGASSPAAARAERRPSAIACSISSKSPSPEPSEEAASSVTSSAPSMSWKRERGTNDWRPPSPKRLRSSSRRMAAAGSLEPNSAPIATRARAALRDLPQAKNSALKKTGLQSGPITPSNSRADPTKVTPLIEVVIINQPVSVKPLIRTPSMARQQQEQQPPPPTLISSPSEMQGPRRSTRTRPPPVERIIPCSDDDSEDELSFLL
ncbi:hypothetical protein ASPNIDRAFT_194532 [Aspergillus niger ATCC 1015]|uniref:Uncharacterized protein n=2 Tax=Aspergillus niger TaxID=5061 RepID=G3Y721_ASPNA|nr:hypothetical protein ASPNIDRAFT_194532 [Aspergillus niger ATCC 1015]KAI3001194.1 hypothetical protein CBS147345_8697 [Aspergillus niger]TPR10381.1 LysM domain family protein [Aspergillus niger]SPB50846.1 unnamed protein product [Aspergillus niger]